MRFLVRLIIRLETDPPEHPHHFWRVLVVVVVILVVLVNLGIVYLVR